MSVAPSPKNAAVLIKRASSAYNASNFDQAIEHSRAALIVLGGMEDETAQDLLDQAYERLTMSYQRIGNYTTAMDVVAEWETRAKRDESRVRAKIQRSRVENYVGNYDDGMRLADDAIAEAKQAGMILEEGIATRIRADMLWKRGRPEEALKLGQRAVALLEQTGALEPQAGARVTMAAAYHSSGQFYKAIEQLQITARIVEQLGRQYELAIVYSNLGETYAELYAMDKALEFHQKALELVGLDRANADLIRNYGSDLIAVGRTEEGLRHLNLALERAQQINDPDMIAQVLYSLAKYELMIDHFDEALAYGKDLQEIAERLDSLRHRIRGMMILGEASHKRGDHGAAQIVFNEASMLAQKSADRSTIWRTHAALAALLQDTMPQVADIHRRMAAEMMNTILTSIEDEELRQAFQNAAPVKTVLGQQS